MLTDTSNALVFRFSPAKSSHPKKNGNATKNTPPSSSSATLHPRGAKDADAGPQNSRKDGRTGKKPDPPPSSVPPKTSETSGRPADPKSSPHPSQGISTSVNDKDGARGASAPGSPPKVSAASEETQSGEAPDPQRGAPDSKNCTEDTSCLSGEVDYSSRGDRPRRTGGEGGEDQTRGQEEEPSEESSLR